MALANKLNKTHDERRVRVDLAALYRLFVHYGWTDLTYTHISARAPDNPEHYYINPYGLLFDEISASNLLRVDLDGNVVSGDHPYNEAGHLIHTAILKTRPEIDFVLHAHTRAGVAVSAMRCGLLPLSQHANTIGGSLVYHDYADVTLDAGECERLARDMGDNYLMLMRNHGSLALGRTAAEGFLFMYYLEMACKIQVDILHTGQEFVTPKPEVIESVKQHYLPGETPWGATVWSAMLRMLDAKYPDFKQ